jgi:hypothetical protein
MNIDILQIALILVSGIFIMLAAIMNATMDVSDYKLDKSIFLNLFKFKMFFGIDWNTWVGPKKWLNKYIDRDPDKGLREDKILFIKANFVQLYDIWHFAKMWMVVFFIFATLFALFAITLGFDYTNWVSWVFLVSTFIYYGLCWNVPFNIFWNKILIRK